MFVCWLDFPSCLLSLSSACPVSCVPAGVSEGHLTMGKGCKVVVCGLASVGKTAILEQLLYGSHSVGKWIFSPVPLSGPQPLLRLKHY